MEQNKCPLCGKEITILQGAREVVCPKCGNVIPLQAPASKPRIRRPKYQIGMLLILIAILAGVWVCVGSGDSGKSQPQAASVPASSWIEDIGGEPHAANAGRVSFTLYQFNSDDTVRIVNTKLIPGDGGTTTNIWSPWLRPGDEMLDVDFINAVLISQYSYEEEYHGRLDTCYNYAVKAWDDHYGYDMLTARGYLHVRETDRLISIGSDPQDYYSQDIAAVAVPLGANITSIYDYQPYRHITLDQWDVFYYDTTDITSHVSIHIAYIPGDDAPSLDWADVEELR